MPPGGDPAFLIFGSFDQAKERTRKNKFEEYPSTALRIAEQVRKRNPLSRQPNIPCRDKHTVFIHQKAHRLFRVFNDLQQQETPGLPKVF